MCLESLREFLAYTTKIHKKVSDMIVNYNIFLRKIEGLSLHPDSFRRLAGLMSIKQLVSQSILQPNLLKKLFFDICYFFFVLVRTNDRQNGDNHSNDCQIFCEDIFNKLKYIIEKYSSLFLGYKDDMAKFEDAEDFTKHLQKNLFVPETNLRNYSLRLWLLVTREKSELLSR